jgi:hypothetical protein
VTAGCLASNLGGAGSATRTAGGKRRRRGNSGGDDGYDYEGEEYEDDDLGSDALSDADSDDPELAYLLPQKAAKPGPAASPSSSSASSAAGAPGSVCENTVLADRVRVAKSGGVWRLKLRSGCARLGGQEHRVLNWNFKINMFF